MSRSAAPVAQAAPGLHQRGPCLLPMLQFLVGIVMVRSSSWDAPVGNSHQLTGHAVRLIHRKSQQRASIIRCLPANGATAMACAREQERQRQAYKALWTVHRAVSAPSRGPFLHPQDVQRPCTSKSNRTCCPGEAWTEHRFCCCCSGRSVLGSTASSTALWGHLSGSPTASSCPGASGGSICLQGLAHLEVVAQRGRAQALGRRVQQPHAGLLGGHVGQNGAPPILRNLAVPHLCTVERL